MRNDVAVRGTLSDVDDKMNCVIDNAAGPGCLLQVYRCTRRPVLTRCILLHAWQLGPPLFARSVPVYPYTLDVGDKTNCVIDNALGRGHSSLSSSA
jgi:hypothetical protein